MTEEPRYADLEQLRAWQKESMQLQQQVVELWQKIFHVMHEGLFCDSCGRIEPPDGFYPLNMGGPDSISGYLCHECASKRGNETKTL